MNAPSASFRERADWIRSDDAIRTRIRGSSFFFSKKKGKQEGRKEESRGFLPLYLSLSRSLIDLTRCTHNTPIQQVTRGGVSRAPETARVVKSASPRGSSARSPRARGSCRSLSLPSRVSLRAVINNRFNEFARAIFIFARDASATRRARERARESEREREREATRAMTRFEARP